MATELVNSATSEKLPEMDWTRSIEICELVSRDQRQAREVIKAIKKRLGSKNPNVQLFAVMLLEILMNNLGDEVHKQVIDVGLLPLLVKIVKKKSDLPVREKIFLLLDATQTATGGGSGKFPQYYEAYYDLVNAGVKFPDRPPQAVAVAVSNQVNSIDKKHSPSNHHADYVTLPPAKPLPEAVPASSSIVEKASAALEVLREVLDAVDPHHPEGAKDEFTLDLVEQCSFQQQRVMHLVVTSHDDKVVSRAIDLNEQLQKLLARHDELISGKITSSSDHHTHEDADEEEVEQLVRRMRKGKACMQHEEEDHHRHQKDRPFGLLGGGTNISRPIIRPLSIDEPQEQQQQQQQPPIRPGVLIPPPPAKHVEREKFFQEKKVDGSGLANHVRGLSLHSRNGSSSYSVGSVDSD